MASKRQGADVKYGDGSIRIRERKDGGKSYQARWFDGLQMRAKTFHGSIEQAEDFLRQRGRDVRTGKYVADEDVTLTNAIDDYLRRGESRWRSNTRAVYRSIADQVAEHTIGKTRLSDITPRQCQAWMDELSKKYSPSRLTVVRAVVNGAIGEAMRLGVTQSNPMQGIRMPANKKREYSVWTPEQASRAIELSEGIEPLHTYYIVALTTGMRPGELRALMWGDVDFENGRITVARTMTRGDGYEPIIGATTKGGRSRKVTVTDEVMDALRAHKRSQNERRLKAEYWHTANLVFDRGNGSPLPQQTLAKAHRAFAHKHGLPECRLHDLRHAAASILFQAGVPIKVISETLGHASVTITMDIYAHVDESQQREVAETMRSALALKRKAN